MLLCCGPQDEPDEDNEAGIEFTAEDIGDYIINELRLVDRTLDNVDFLVGDNCAVNKRMARLMGKVLVGCASHRLNLAVDKILFAQSSYAQLISKVDFLMKELSTLKNGSKLRKQTELLPQRRNVTRWSSVYNMLTKYLRLEPFLLKCNFNSEVIEKLLTPLELNELKEMIKTLLYVQKVTKTLQESGMDLHKTRALFDALLVRIPHLDTYLSDTAPIIHNRDFERAVTKVQSNDESSLTRAEANSIKHFLLSNTDDMDNDDIDDSNSTEDDEDIHFISNVLKEASSRKEARVASTVTKYRSMNHIVSQSNICERLFSHAKIIMTDQRKHMMPYRLEGLLFLNFNKFLWNASTIQDILRANDSEI